MAPKLGAAGVFALERFVGDDAPPEHFVAAVGGSGAHIVPRSFPPHFFPNAGKKRGGAAKKGRQRGMWAPLWNPPATDAGGEIALAL